MEVELTVTFLVTGPEDAEDGEELSENHAWSAADLARHHFLALIKESTQGGEVDSVTVHVDGLGKCQVALVEA